MIVLYRINFIWVCVSHSRKSLLQEIRTKVFGDDEVSSYPLPSNGSGQNI